MKKYRIFFHGQSVDVVADKIEKNEGMPSWEEKPGEVKPIPGCVPQFSLTLFKADGIVGYFPFGVPSAYVVLEASE